MCKAQKIIVLIIILGFVLCTTSVYANELVNAAAMGDLKQVKELLDQGEDIHAKNNKGASAIIAAAKFGHLGVVKYLVAHGADINDVVLIDKEEYNAMLLAIIFDHYDVVEYLIQKGYDINPRFGGIERPLVLASTEGKLEIAELLIKSGADIDGKGFFTPLMAASSHGHIKIVSLLIDYGTDINRKFPVDWDKNLDYHTALTFAIDRGHDDIVKLLRSHGAINTTVISQSVINLIEASSEGDLAKVIFLINKRTDVNAKNKNGDISIHTASFNGHTEIVKALIENGADVNITDVNCSTALMKASFKGMIDVVKILIESGADINAVNKNGKTALDFAVKKNHSKVIDYLKANNAE